MPAIIIDYNEICDKMIYEFLTDNYPIESNGELWDSFLRVAFYEDKYLVTNANKWFYEQFKDQVKFINVPGSFKGDESARAKFLKLKKERGID